MTSYVKLVSLRRMTGRFLVDERGATAIEYAMVAAGVALAIMTTVYNLGNSVLTNLFNKIANAVT